MLNKSIIKLVVACGLLLAVSTSIAASKKITTSLYTINLGAHLGKSDYFTVTNKGTAKAYVLLSASKVINPDRSNAKLITNKNPKKLGLLVTPNKLILKPNQSRKVKVTSLVKNNDTDVVFRINGSEVAMPKKGKSLEKGQTGFVMDVGIGFTTTVIARPAKMQPKLDSKIVDGKLLLTNVGNTSFSMTNIRQCPSKDQCFPFSNKFFFPGIEKTITLNNAGGDIDYEFVYPGTKEEKTIAN